jgi:hypothetical protein
MDPESEMNKIEKILAQFKPQPPPAGLKASILASIEVRMRRSIQTRRRAALIIAVALISTSVILDLQTAVLERKAVSLGKSSSVGVSNPVDESESDEGGLLSGDWRAKLALRNRVALGHDRIAYHNRRSIDEI